METKLAPREATRALLDRLSDDATFEEIQYELYALDKIDRGLEDVKAGRVTPHADVEDELARWLK